MATVWMLTRFWTLFVGLPWVLTMIVGLAVIRRAGREWDRITNLKTPCQGRKESGNAGIDAQ